MMDNMSCFVGFTRHDVQGPSHLGYEESGMRAWTADADPEEKDGDEASAASFPGETYDPLSMYLDEISAAQLLKRSEELEIAKRIHGGKEKAMQAIFSIPFTVKKLLLSAEMVKQGKASLNDIVQSEDVPGSIPGETEKRFFACIRQIARLYQQGTASTALPSATPMKKPVGTKKKSPGITGQQTLWHNKIPAKIIAMRPKFDFVRGLFKEIEENVRSIEKALQTMDRREYCRKKGQYERFLGATLEEVDRLLQDYAVAHEEVYAAKMTLVQANLRLVVHTARRYAGIGTIGISDLIQEGNIGLMRAAELFDHRKGFKFSTYATCWIKQTITRALSNNSRMIRLPVHTAYEVSKIIHASRDLVQETGDEPTPEELSARVNMPTKKVQNLLGISKEPLSLSMSMGEDNAPLSDYIEDHTIPSALDTVIKDDLRDKISRAISSLCPKEKRIVKVRYGIGEEEQTLEALAQEFGVTRERIRQIEMKAIRKLKLSLAVIET
jgi:RNA polymerase primary sigma factor